MYISNFILYIRIFTIHPLINSKMHSLLVLCKFFIVLYDVYALIRAMKWEVFLLNYYLSSKLKVSIQCGFFYSHPTGFCNLKLKKNVIHVQILKKFIFNLKMVSNVTRFNLFIEWTKFGFYQFPEIFSVPFLEFLFYF